MSVVTDDYRKQIENVVNDSLEIINNTRQKAVDVLQPSASLEQVNLNAKLVEHILNNLERDIKFKSDHYCSRIYNYLICIAMGIMFILVGLIIVFMVEPALLGAEHNRSFKTIVQIITSNCTCELNI